MAENKLGKLTRAPGAEEISPRESEVACNRSYKTYEWPQDDYAAPPVEVTVHVLESQAQRGCNFDRGREGHLPPREPMATSLERRADVPWAGATRR